MQCAETTVHCGALWFLPGQLAITHPDQPSPCIRISYTLLSVLSIGEAVVYADGHRAKTAESNILIAGRKTRFLEMGEDVPGEI